MAERSISVKLTLDASQVTRSVQEAVTSLDRLERNAKSAGEQLDRLNRRLDETSRSVTQATMRLITFDVALGETEARLRALNTEMAVPGAVKFAKGMADAETKLSGVKQTTKDTTTEQEKLGAKTKEVGQTFERAAGETSMLEAALRTARGRVTELNTSFEKTGSEDTLKGIRAARREITALESDIKAATKDVENAAGTAASNAAGSAIGRGLGSVFNVSPELALGIGAAITAGAPLIGAALNGALLVGAGMGGIGLGIIGQLHNPALRAAVSEVGMDLEHSLTDATKGMAAPLASAVREIGTSLTGLLSHIDFSKIEQEIKPLADGISGLFRNLGPGLGDIFSASLPLMRQFADDLPRVGKALSDMLHQIATAPGSAEGLHVLMNMIEGAIEFVGKLLNTLGGVFVYFEGFGPTLKAAAELVGFLASAVHILADVLGQIDPNILAFGAGFLLLQGRITKAADALIALRTATMGVIAANAIADAEGLAGGLGKVEGSAGNAAKALGGIGKAGGAIATVLGGIGDGLKSLAGPVGILLGVTAIGLGFILGSYNKQQASVRDLTKSLTELDREYETNHNMSSQSFQDIVNGNGILKDAARNAERYGISISTITKAVSGNVGAMQSLNTAVDNADKAYAEGVKSGDIYIDRMTGIAHAVGDTGRRLVENKNFFDKLSPAVQQAAKDAADYAEAQRRADDAQNSATASSRALSGVAKQLGADYVPLVNLMGVLGDEARKGADAHAALGDAIKKVNEQVIPASHSLDEYRIIADGIGVGVENAASMTQDFSAVLTGIGHVAGDTTKQMSTLETVYNNIADAQLNATDKAQLLDQAWQQMRGPVINLEKATDAYKLQLLELEGTYDRNSKGVLVYKGSLDENSRSMNQNSIQGIHNRETLLNLLDTSYQMYLAEVRATGQEDVAREHMRLRNIEIDNQAKKTGLDKVETDKLVGSYNTIPPSKNTNVTVSPRGFDTIMQDLLNTLLAQYIAAHPGVTRQEAQRYYRGQGFAATGGPIVGPGGPKDDMVPLWASHGEFMQQAAAVDYYGIPFMHALNERKVPKEALAHMPRFADGGFINYQNNVAKFANYPRQMNQWSPDFPVPVEFNKTVVPKFVPPSFSGGVGSGPSGPVSNNLRGWIAAAEAWTGVGPTWTNPLITLIMRESGGNPNSINLTDSNAQRGDPSRGLMQTIGSTFAAYRLPQLPNNIYDPVANIVAGIRYILSRYGSIFNVQQANPNLPPKGYEKGAWNISTDQLAFLHKREMVVPAVAADALRAAYEHATQGRQRGQFASQANTSVVRHEHHVIIEGTGVLRGLRKEIRAQGGDVQGVLGS